MRERVAAILANIRELERELEDEFRKKREELKCRFEKGRVWFDKEVVEEHRRLKRSLLQQIKGVSLAYIVTSPVIYSMIIPLVILDLFVTIYQYLCFTLYGIPRVRRSDYFFIDREKLAYLNIFEKFNCLYCSYANNLLAYAVEIAGRTEQYWCPIKHADKLPSPHSRYNRFLEFGDAEGYKNGLNNVSADFEDLEEKR